MDERPNSSGLLVAMLAIIAHGLLVAGGIAGGVYLYSRHRAQYEC